MKVLITGANGYIGVRLLSVLVEQDHEIHCFVRDRRRLYVPERILQRIRVYEVNLLERLDPTELPEEIDVAYYLIHSMSSSGDFEEMEGRTARHFAEYVKHIEAGQVVYLGGIANDDNLSPHLRSRERVEGLLRAGGRPLTVLRAGIIVGSGSASFEIIRDLVEKLPVMVAPKWLRTRCQPIAVRNVIGYLAGVMGNEGAYDRTFDIGGPEVLTYQQMLLQFAEVRGIRRYIVPVPYFTPRLSSYWLYFVTSTSYSLARHLVGSLKNEVVVQRRGIEKVVEQELVDYRTAVALAFERIQQNMVVSSWKDALAASAMHPELLQYVEVPTHGCFRDVREVKLRRGADEVLENVWAIGGQRGWYFGNQLWKVRGYLDRLVGGVGLRRGRRSPTDLHAGDALDFWRVLLADKPNRRLLLYAEMKLPGEAWLEFRITTDGGHEYLKQTATFRPKGLWGRLYWYLLVPAHEIIFTQMLRRIAAFQQETSLISQ
ncbi:MAG: SDR family oxidoreductase [Catalinimonas sp.]